MFGLRKASSGVDRASPSHLGNVEFTSEDFHNLFDLYVLHNFVNSLICLYPIVLSSISIATSLYSTLIHRLALCRRTRLFCSGR
jgi:hypothetical protein